LRKVAIFTQRAAQRRVESIIAINSTEFLSIIDESMIHHLIVSTTSHPAIKAHPASNTTAIAIAPPSVRAFEPTAGPILLATSLAHKFMAIYIAKIVASSKYIFPFSN